MPSASAEPLLATIAATTREPARLTRRALATVRAEPVRRRPTAAPGVGARPGLAPKRRRSGETDVRGGVGRRRRPEGSAGGVGRCGDELAGTALREAARSLPVRGRERSAPRAWGMQLAERRGMARARVAVARGLAVVPHRVRADGAELGRGEGAVAAASA